MSAAEKATDIVADVAEEVAEQALEVADISRASTGRNLGWAFGGFLIGAAVGGGVAYFVLSKRLETKYTRIADEEIDEMRKHFAMKTKAAEGTAQKAAVEAIISTQNYSNVPPANEGPPMAVQPPNQSVTEVEDEVAAPKPEPRNVFKQAELVDEWDWHKERSQRSPDTPYVIHYDERHEMDFQSMTLTYFDGDDVLCNEQDEVYDHEERNKLIGEANLNKFGHGSNDPSIVYIRNDELELVFEVCQSDQRYAETVHGFTHDAYDRGNLERMRLRERDAQEE